MTFWQYAILRYTPRQRGGSAAWADRDGIQTYSDPSILYLLDQAGAQGWELVGTFVTTDHAGPVGTIEYTFKRPLYAN
jgi:hypothetical protein